MNGHITSSLAAILKAVSFAGRAHLGQMRKDGETPYACHVFRVCLILRHVLAIADEQALTAAVLHDVLEDTTFDFDDLEEKFGAEIASWVAALSKDSRLPYERREQQYCQALAAAPWQVQVCKLADIVDNLLDSANFSKAKRLESIRKIRRYLDAMAANVKAEAKQAWEITNALYQDIEGQLLQ